MKSSFLINYISTNKQQTTKKIQAVCTYWHRKQFSCQYDRKEKPNPMFPSSL